MASSTGGRLSRRAEGAGEKRHRQHDHVDDRGDRLGRADQRGRREAEPGERDRAQPITSETTELKRLLGGTSAS